MLFQIQNLWTWDISKATRKVGSVDFLRYPQALLYRVCRISHVLRMHQAKAKLCVEVEVALPVKQATLHASGLPGVGGDGEVLRHAPNMRCGFKLNIHALRTVLKKPFALRVAFIVALDEVRGANSDTSVLASPTDDCMQPRMCKRASLACASATCMISLVMPWILMSICSAVMPAVVPATLKSMSPR